MNPEEKLKELFDRIEFLVDLEREAGPALALCNLIPVIDFGIRSRDCEITAKRALDSIESLVCSIENETGDSLMEAREEALERAK